MSHSSLERIVSDCEVPSATPEGVAKPPSSALPQTLSRLSTSAVQYVAEALKDAAHRLQQTMAGDSVFACDSDRRIAVSLVNRLNQLLPMFEKYHDEDEKEKLCIPACPTCGAGPGQHWAHDCPRTFMHEQEEFVYDYRRRKLLMLKDLDDPFTCPDSDDYGPAMIPRCGVCGAGPAPVGRTGAHKTPYAT